MRHRAALRTLAAGMALAWLLLAGASRTPRAQSGSQGPIVAGNPAPSPEQLHALVQRAIENQHRDDHALEEFERVEHRVTRKGENADIITDITERIVPSPGGNIKLRTRENGAPVSPEQYRRELEFTVEALGRAQHPDDSFKDGEEKTERREHEHNELVDEAPKAFRISFAGRETRPDPAAPHGTRTLVKLLLDPDPNYKPVSRFAASFAHIHAALWVDEDEAQFARLEADIATDIIFAGGIAGRVYHGGHVVMEQREVAPGVWLPTLYMYNVDGRKFVFAFGVHEHTEITNYRHIGPPAQSIEVMRNELNNLSAATPVR